MTSTLASSCSDVLECRGIRSFKTGAEFDLSREMEHERAESRACERVRECIGVCSSSFI